MGTRNLGLAGLVIAMTASLPAGAQDSVNLSFAWPTPVHARVAATLQEKSHWVEMNLDKAMTLSGTFEMRADRSPDGHVHARFREPELTTATGTAGKATLRITELIPLLPLTFEPSVAMSRDGTFLKVEDAEEFRSALIDLVTKNLGEAAQNEPLHGFIPEAIRGHASDKRLDGLANMRWRGMVGMWNGQTLRLGEVVRWTEKPTIPIAGEPILPYQYQAEFVGRVDCSADASARRCVELHLIAEVAEEDLRAFAEAVRRSLPAATADGTSVEYPELRIEVRLVTDPDTLLPYRYRQSVRQAMKMIGKTSTMETHTQDDLELIYAY